MVWALVVLRQISNRCNHHDHTLATAGHFVTDTSKIIWCMEFGPGTDCSLGCVSSHLKLLLMKATLSLHSADKTDFVIGIMISIKYIRDHES